MVVEVITYPEEELEARDYRDKFEVYVDEVLVFNVWEDEPEDMNFGRTLSDILTIPDLLRLAFDAGKNGEEFVLNHKYEVD